MNRLTLLNQLSELCFRMNPSFTRTSSDKELEQYLADGIKETERELQETKALLLLANAEIATLKTKAVVPDEFVCDNKQLERLLNATAMILESPCPDSATYWAACLSEVEQLLAASPAQPQSAVMVPRELLERMPGWIGGDWIEELRALLGGDQPAQPGSAKGGEE